MIPSASAQDEAEAAWLPCVYGSSAEGAEGEWMSHPHCARVDESGTVRIASTHLDRADYVDGLASMFIDGHWFYVRRDGTALQVVTYDNGPDYWQEGRVRGVRRGRLLYFDRHFGRQPVPVIDAQLDWGWPFEEGLALVCRGCRVERVGEHTSRVGGLWGAIALNGDVVIPIEHSRSRAAELLRGKRSSSP